MPAACIRAPDTALIEIKMLVAIAESPWNLQRAAPLRSAEFGAGKAGETECSSCPVCHLCLPSRMNGIARAQLGNMNCARRKVAAGETVYGEGDPFQYLHAVRSGTLKSSLALPGGRKQVSGFHIAGELVGFDGMADGHHASATVALEDSELCLIPFSYLAALAVRHRGMQHSVSRLLGREILRRQLLMVILGTMSAQERLGAFLCHLSKQYSVRGYSMREFHLRMSRAEVASYLGVELETVSRAFATFRRQRLLEVKKRHIRIIDLEDFRRRFEIRLCPRD